MTPEEKPCARARGSIVTCSVVDRLVGSPELDGGEARAVLDGQGQQQLVGRGGDQPGCFLSTQPAQDTRQLYSLWM